MNDVGIMQGRLSPPSLERPQAFPWSSWEREFEYAKACGFDAIEWLFEAERYEQNPIWTASGSKKINRLIVSSGIQVRSVCADYFMFHPFFRVSEGERAQSVAVLNRLIEQVDKVGVRVILLPVLEVSEIRTVAEKNKLLASLHKPLSAAARHGIKLGLETELPAGEFRALIEQVNNAALGVYYDTGNATARGYDIVADTAVLGPFLHGVHIKDRKRGGSSVLLGHGDADFASFSQVLNEVGYVGPLILETPRGNDPLDTAKAHLKFVKRLQLHNSMS